MTAPATAKTAQQVAQDAAREYYVAIHGEKTAALYASDSGQSLLSAIILRAIAEAVEATGAREHLAAYRDEQIGFAHQIISPRRLHVEYRERAERTDAALAALDELGRAK